jgi:glycosyltransferase involved in cell wall biosynthesis
VHVMLIDFNFFAYSTHLASALSELCEVTLMLPDQAPAHCATLLNPQVHLRWFHKSRIRYPSNLFMVRSLFKAITDAKPDVVHQVAWHPWFNLALPLFPRLPLVTTIHDASTHPGDYRKPFLSWQWHRASHIIVHAESIRHQMISTHGLDADRVVVIPHGALNFYRAWAEEEVLEQENFVLFFGRISEYKGLQFLIEAEPLISAQVPGVRIVIAGEGEPFDRYERMMVHRDRFIIHNYHIPDEQVASLFQQASVVVLPYVEASQSGVATIAFAFGKPVVATTVGGLPEMIQDGGTGYLVPPRDASRLAEAVVSLLKSPELRRKMGYRAHELAEAGLSWPAIAQQTLEVYQQAAAQGVRRWSWKS